MKCEHIEVLHVYTHSHVKLLASICKRIAHLHTHAHVHIHTKIRHVARILNLNLEVTYM